MSAPKNADKVYGRKLPDGRTLLHREEPFDGNCELCGQNGRKSDSSGLRPYGPGGEWICLTCAKKDPETTERRMGQVIFQKGLS